MRTTGSTNFFKRGELYYLKDAIPYLEKIFPKDIPVPKSWHDGGGLQKYAKEFGITPDEDNGITGRGHHARYGKEKMYEFCDRLVELKKRKKRRKGKPSRQELPQKSTNQSKKVFDSQISIADIMSTPKQNDEFKIIFELFVEQLDKHIDKHMERKLTELLEKQQNKDERTESR